MNPKQDNMSFSSLGISEVLIRAIKSNGFTEPYPIQKEAIPQILKKRDVLGIAQTGSGKTASYVLPLLQNFEGKTSTKNRHINVLVLVPTRELAIQVQEVFHLFHRHSFRIQDYLVFSSLGLIGIIKWSILTQFSGI